MTKKVKAFLAVLVIAAFVSMGWSFYDVLPIDRIDRVMPGRSVSAEEMPDMTALAAPHYIIAGEGSYEYKITDRNLALPEDLILSSAADDTAYSSFLAAVSVIVSAGGAPQLEDGGSDNINSESYANPSMTAIFEYALPFSEFLAYHGCSSQGAAQVGDIHRISVLADGSLLLYNRESQSYYRYPASAASDSDRFRERLAAYIDYVYQTTDAPVQMQSITSLTGVENNTLLLPTTYYALETSPYESEWHPDQPEDIQRIRSVCFPGGEDFIHDIPGQEGSLTMMYGVGSTVANCSASGRMTYTQVFDKKQYRKTGFYEALEQAAAFLFTGDGYTEELGALDLYLKEVERITQDGCQGYRFAFAASTEGLEVMYQTHPLLSVEIIGRQVTACTRDLPDVRGLLHAEQPLLAMDGMELIRSNSDIIAEIILDAYAGDNSINTEKYTANDNFYAVATSITDAHLSMVRPTIQPAEETNDNRASDEADDTAETVGLEAATSQMYGDEAVERQLLPAWYFAIDGIDFWFDATSGELISYMI